MSGIPHSNDCTQCIDERTQYNYCQRNPYVFKGMKYDEFKTFVDGSDTRTMAHCGMHILMDLMCNRHSPAFRYLLDSKKIPNELFLWPSISYDGIRIFFHVCVILCVSHEDIIYLLESDYITAPNVNYHNPKNNATPLDVICTQFGYCNLAQRIVNSGKITYESFVDTDGIIDLSKIACIHMLKDVLKANIIPDEMFNKIVIVNGEEHSIITRGSNHPVFLEYLANAGKIPKMSVNCFTSTSTDSNISNCNEETQNLDEKKSFVVSSI